MQSSTVCLIIKNEAPYIIEWMAHYLTLGFNRLAIYDNGSTDGTSDIIMKCAQIDERISLTAWPGLEGESPQRTAYQDAVRIAKTDWIAFFDTDEFLVVNNHECISTYLSNAPSYVGAIAVNWLLFGSGGEVTYRNEPVSQRFKKCAVQNWGKNRIFKTIARVSNISDVFPHHVELNNGEYVNDVWEPALCDGVKTELISHKNLQLNHYVLRSEGEYKEKVDRGNSNLPEGHQKKRSKFNQEFWDTHDTNHREDGKINRWANLSASLAEKFKASL